MVKIRKRTGIPQEFDSKKLQRSLECAGVPSDIAAGIAGKINPTEGMSTWDIRRSITRILSEINPAYMASYDSTRNLNARGSEYVSKGICRINEEFMNDLGLKSGQNVMILAGEKKSEMRVESVPSLSPREVLMNDSELDKLSIKSGTRVSVKSSLRQ